MALIKNEDGNNVGVISINRDIAARKKLEQKKDDFIALASHELKTPVTTLKVYTEMLQNKFRLLNDKNSLSYLAKMDKQIYKLTNLVDELLDVSRIESGNLKYQMREFNLGRLINETIDNIRLAKQKPNINIRSDVNYKVFGDRDRVGQVVTNLTVNAIKYSPKDKDIEIMAEPLADQVVVTVRDFGPGIPENEHQNIFGKFYQVTEKGRQTFPGLGMGLFISSQIVAKHSGKIWVKSNPGDGSEFCFSLPKGP